MKYYFVLDSLNKRHIIVAENEENLMSIVIDDKMTVVEFYELTPDKFTTSGFLISDK
jgi:hypothetical protein